MRGSRRERYKRYFGGGAGRRPSPFPPLVAAARSIQTRKMVISWKMPRVMNWKNQCRPRMVLLHLGRRAAGSATRAIGMVG